MGVVYFTARHRQGTPMMPVSFFGIGRQQITAYFSSLLITFLIIGIAPLDYKTLDYAVKLCIVKIALTGQVNEVGFVVRYVVV